ncbi:unnamed protein product [Pseudo-nitzschia multistriata]|uniref:Uncharacterized protein n=1 Tax=Pseudo-nitzschia multistriata TaxID=183589 RepID=A0A448Z157_9STRA|nr:unnamed protein product [Pseudo-nitzschia multistriata]
MVTIQILNCFENDKIMYSKIATLFVVLAVVSVQGFAPVAQPRVAANTELNAFFFQKPSEEAGAAVAAETKKVSNPFAKFAKPAAEKKAAPAKKAPVKKIVAKKAVAKKAVAKKAPVKKVAAKTNYAGFTPVKAEKKTKLTIFERQCHIN